MATKNVVVHSINLDGEARCVDVFARPDGSFGYEEYRREPEDGRGWYAIGHTASLVFATSNEALIAAVAEVAWLAGALASKPANK